MICSGVTVIQWIRCGPGSFPAPTNNWNFWGLQHELMKSLQLNFANIFTLPVITSRCKTVCLSESRFLYMLFELQSFSVGSISWTNRFPLYIDFIGANCKHSKIMSSPQNHLIVLKITKDFYLRSFYLPFVFRVHIYKIFFSKAWILKTFLFKKWKLGLLI